MAYDKNAWRQVKAATSVITIIGKKLVVRDENSGALVARLDETETLELFAILEMISDDTLQGCSAYTRSGRTRVEMERDTAGRIIFSHQSGPRGTVLSPKGRDALHFMLGEAYGEQTLWELLGGYKSTGPGGSIAKLKGGETRSRRPWLPCDPSEDQQRNTVQKGFKEADWFESKFQWVRRFSPTLREMHGEWRCIHCGKTKVNKYIATGHDHTDYSYQVCNCPGARTSGRPWAELN